MWPKLASNLRSSSLSLPNAGITGVYHCVFKKQKGKKKLNKTTNKYEFIVVILN
jgi:hypothetical protein